MIYNQLNKIYHGYIFLSTQKTNNKYCVKKILKKNELSRIFLGEIAHFLLFIAYYIVLINPHVYPFGEST